LIIPMFAMPRIDTFIGRSNTIKRFMAFLLCYGSQITD